MGCLGPALPRPPCPALLKSCLQMIQTFEAASGRKVPHELAGRRAGDAAAVYASPKVRSCRWQRLMRISTWEKRGLFA